MSPQDFLQVANLLPEAMLLLSGDGRIIAANRSAGSRLHRAPEALHGEPLTRFLADPPAVVTEYLRTCSRTREPVPGSLTLAPESGEAIACRTLGAALRPRTAEGPAILLLRLVPRAESPSQFAILNERIEELTREIIRRKQFEAELRAHREWLQVTLSSIGDAVITTDENGCITFLNPVAITLTGWTQDEAIGQSLGVVFQIVNESTREPVEHPVAKVLAEGHVIGLANHTILIARDGTEHPIDDSAAPIKDEDGIILGVVLIFREVSERRRMERELRERAEALAAAAQRRDEFMAMLAHELRNPLAPMSNALQILHRIGSPDPHAVRAREVIGRQITHQARLINDLLDLSRITQGRITLQAEPLDLTQLVLKTAEDHRGVLEGRGLTFTVAVPETPVWVKGDETRLAEVLGNLLDNAGKFTDEGGSVTVQLAEQPETRRAVLSVRDTGIGIEPEVLPYIFDTFAQADRSLDRSRGGLGLGLALVKGLVELHGGEVQATSAGLGHGAEFTVSLPLATAPAVPETGTSPPPAIEPIRVLVIEDNRDAADSLRDLLELVGCHAQVAYTGGEGIEAARQFRPQVVLCDVGLPGMDGYQVAQRLRQLPVTAAARLIAITGYGGEEEQRRALAAGFDHHLTKPVDFAELQPLLGTAGTPRREGGRQGQE